MATLTLEQALQTATAHHQAGQLREAEIIYRQILHALPDHAEALHRLGLIALAAGHPAAALELIGKAISRSPTQGIYHANLGETYRTLGQWEHAITSFRHALTLHPGLPSAQTGLGAALVSAQRWDEAIAHYERVLAARPGTADELLYCGVALNSVGRVEEAIARYRQALALRPDYSEALNNLGSACMETGQRDEAISSFEDALRLNPNNAEAHNNLGNVHLQQERTDAAIACFRRALALKPDFGPAHLNLSSALRHIGDAEPALEHCQRAVERLPANALANWQLAELSLLLGRCEQGWKQYEWRFRVPYFGGLARDFAQPRWKGEAAPGQTILLHREQGFGDTIQFLRYVPRVRESFAHIILECPDALVRLVTQSGSFGADFIGSRDTIEKSACAFDLHLPLPSLPLTLGIFEPLPMSEPYLRADDELRRAWRQRLQPGSRLRIGLAWAGSPEHPEDRRRSLDFAALAPLLGVPEISFYSLQVGPGRASADQLAASGVIAFTPELTDFADTAALISELDLTITVDTAIAHLAGALGRPVWTLLPFIPDWRWGLNREDTAWYPTMRLFRQPTSGDWRSVLHRVAEALRHRS